MIGRTLLHYRVVQKLGAGGMGVVYRAEDTKLDRQVAIKILPDIFSSDPEHLARFQREAKLLAALNHSNIAAIHGLEEVSSQRFLVMELVEGETLAQRIAKGALPVDETLEICRQIAEGLEAAHEKGIIHRDLKPANVKITPEGKVKLLDFGLAKAFQEAPATTDLHDSPTVTDQVSRPGVILGTAAYMSPEQARGKALDKRTDIWAFGCVLYECLAGKRAFQGDTITETLAAILKGEPEWTQLPVETPSSVCAVLRRCLQKDPNLRIHDIADARLEMREEPATPPARTSLVQRHSLGWFLSIGAAVLAIGLLIGVTVTKYLQPPALPTSQAVVRSPVRLESGLALAGLPRELDWGRPSRTAMALSNDGRFMIYSAVKENPGLQDKPSLYLRRLDQLEAKPIAGTEGGISPFLSPDDQWVGFWADGKLMKVQAEGGVPRHLCDVAFPFGANWGSDNQIYFGQGIRSGISRVSANGGKAETLTKPDQSKEEFSHRLPFVLPAGKGILFTIMQDYSDLEPRVAVMALSSRKWRVLLENASDGRYAGTGHLVFLRRGTLMAARFDLDRLEVTGQPVPAIPGIMPCRR